MRRGRTAADTALITGASSGIGEALAHRFAAGGCDLVLVARSADKLRALAAELSAAHGIKASVEPKDLSKPDAAGELATTLARKRRRVDILVNNAGVIEVRGFVDTPPERIAALVDLNVVAATAMLSRFLPPMVARKHGRVLNVASLSSFMPVPSMAAYAATKAYLLSLTESLAEELAGTGVTVTALCPGFTATNLIAMAQEANEKVRGLPSALIGDVDDVATAGYEACMKGEVVCVPGGMNRVGAMAGRALPKWMVRRIAGMVGRKAM
jgi:short-subunit dehydrogenase